MQKRIVKQVTTFLGPEMYSEFLRTIPDEDTVYKKMKWLIKKWVNSVRKKEGLPPLD